jgi:hypothetical protein
VQWSNVRELGCPERLTEDKLKRFLISFLASAALLSGNSLLIPSVTVLGTNASNGKYFDNGGPDFTVIGNFLGTDTVSLTVSGTVDLASGNFTANAAGIIVSPSTTNTGDHPGEVALNDDNVFLNYAALLIGNHTLGFFQLFPSSPEFGLGSSTPPTTLTLTGRTLADIGFTSGLTNGTVLDLRVSDINYWDNSGAFQISQAPGIPSQVPGLPISAVPEPGTIGLLGLCLCIVFARLRKAQRA